jgi:hypothetical protein
MSESIGVQAGRVCPGCGREDSVPLLWGLPDFETMRLAERGQVVLGGCMVMGEDPAFACRSCGLEWGREGDPTSDEQELADLLGVCHLDVVRALGAGWRRESVPGERAGVQWFVSGVPAQVAVGVEGPWFVLARPLTRCDEPLQLQPADRQPFTREDLLHLPEVVAEAAEEIAAPAAIVPLVPHLPARAGTRVVHRCLTHLPAVRGGRRPARCGHGVGGA